MTLPGFAHLPDLAAERFGGRAVAANDDFFAPKENLVRSGAPVWIEDKYTDRGKWMDGWETRRRREPGHDWCEVRLGMPGIVRGVVVDTRHFTGNYPESCSLEGAAEADEWVEILPRAPLRGDFQNPFEIDSPYRFARLRLNIHPDGGVARLRVHGEVVPDPRTLPAEFDLAALGHGARVLGTSDAFYGDPQKLLWPGPATHMGDGWETRRRRGAGNDWAEVQLACEGELRQVDVDTSHFKGNAPGWCSIRSESGAEILARTALRPDALHTFAVAGTARSLRLDVFPDGGVARWRVLGAPTAAGREALGMRWLDSLPDGDATQALLAVCGSRRWTRAMIGRRPYGDLAALVAAAESAESELEADDWREAFAAHPRLGSRSDSQWSREEQAGATSAGDGELERLLQSNRRYEDRFGQVFILCATGKSTAEMLAEIDRRSSNDAATELANAAREQGKITRLRLHKLLGVPT